LIPCILLRPVNFTFLAIAESVTTAKSAGIYFPATGTDTPAMRATSSTLVPRRAREIFFSSVQRNSFTEAKNDPWFAERMVKRKLYLLLEEENNYSAAIKK
jgi:hypothetical protein